MNDSDNSNLLTKTEAGDALTRLALDLTWTYNHSADEIWKRLDPEHWELTANRGVALCLEAYEQLVKQGIRARVVRHADAEIADVATTEDIDLIVMPTHAGQFRRLVLGSTTAKVRASGPLPRTDD